MVLLHNTLFAPRLFVGPAQFLGDLVQFVLSSSQLRLQILTRRLGLALQLLQLVCAAAETSAQILRLLRQTAAETQAEHLISTSAPQTRL